MLALYFLWQSCSKRASITPLACRFLLSHLPFVLCGAPVSSLLSPPSKKVRLLDQCANPFAVHSSKAVGEPPFFLATSAFLAAKHAAAAARAHHQAGNDVGAGAGGSFFPLWAPATSERLRLACLDAFTQAAVHTPGVTDAQFLPAGSY